MNDWEVKGRTAVFYRRVANFIQELYPAVLRDQVVFDASFHHSAEAIPLAKSVALPRQAVAEGAVWGRTWESGYFKLSAKVPAAWEGRRLAAWLNFGGEGLVYSAVGVPLYGITSGSAYVEHYNKDIYRLDAPARPGQTIELLVETAANNLFGVLESPKPVKREDPARHGTWEAKVNKIRLCTYDHEVWQLWLDMRWLLQLWEDLDRESVRAVRILKCLFDATVAYCGQPANAAKARAVLARELSKPASASALSTVAVGHAHIDTAWLWRLGETRRKVARTYASQLDLIKKYPGYVFGASAPQHHAWIKQDHPELYQAIKQAIKDGSWEPQGAMWVESDCNLLSGESMVRQVLHGKNYWMDEFGVDVKNCWIPDVFGYTGTMPQIMRRAGVDFFQTQKMSWSKMNVFPHDTFRWRGIDGSEIITHFPPEYTYNSFCTPEVLRRAEKTFHEKAFIDEFITLMGIGDGGGGPKEEHLEHVLRSANCEGLPRTSFGRADALFERLKRHESELEVWVGELYLEYHRGTYTTQAATKRNNRRLEQEIRAVEALWSALPLDQYPATELDAVVKTLLLHQFHDIIPGSSINAVYRDADRAYAAAFATLDQLKLRAAQALTSASAESITFFNCLSHEYQGIMELPADFAGFQLLDSQGKGVPVQREDGRTVARITVPALAFAAFRRGPVLSDAAIATPAAEAVLENELVRYRFDANARIVEALDKQTGKSILKPGQAGNVLTVYEDTPHNFEAWDIDFYYHQQVLENAQGSAWKQTANGAARQILEFRLSVSNSTMVQEISLEAGSKALEFRTRVEWSEAQRMLRVAFPLESLATEASCDVAYGHVKRPTHANTEWDFAKFEVCAHRYVDISDSSGGVALLNDCKYGHSVRDNILDLCLLRSPLYPDPDADQGSHEFRYVLYPHAGDLVHSAVMPAAACLNRSPLVFAGASPKLTGLPVSLSGEGVSLEVLKKAEKQDVLVIRLVETRGLESAATLGCSLPKASLVETDLMEWHDHGGRSLASPVTITLKPFEIRTFKVVKAGA